MVREYRAQLKFKGHKFIPHPLVESVLRWFADLHQRRGMGGMAPCPISWSDLRAYFLLIGVAPERWQIDGIFALDDAWLTYDPPKSEDGATMLDGTGDNIKNTFALLKKPSQTGQRDND